MCNHVGTVKVYFFSITLISKLMHNFSFLYPPKLETYTHTKVVNTEPL